MCNCKHCRERLNEFEMTPELKAWCADEIFRYCGVKAKNTCAVCHTPLKQDYGRAIITSGPYAFSKRKSGSHCPNCGTKNVRDVE